MIATTTNAERVGQIDKKLVALAVRQEIQNKARRELIPFSQYVDPSAAKWYRAKHLRRISDILERVQRRELTRVIINIAPRHWKSSLVNKWEAKLLGDNPKEKIINASRALSLALKFSKQVRQTIQTNRYRSLYPDVKIQKGSESADDWLLEGGYSSSYRAVGTGGGIAGEGATVLVLDDVSDPNKQASQTETENDWEWYKNVIRTRLEPDGVIVVVNNRVGVNDITGYLLDVERNDSADPPHVWTVVDMPAYDETTGEYLWLDRFGLEYYLSLQNDINLWNVQYQQKPTTESGTLIKREWFEKQTPMGKMLDVVPQLPEGVRWKVFAMDAAFTEKQTQKHDPDFTARCKMVFANECLWLGAPRIYRRDVDGVVEDMMTAKMAEPQLQLAMGRIAVRATIIKAMTKAGYSITEFPEKNDPVGESSAWRNLAKQGRMKLVGTVEEWERVLAYWVKFPQGHDDPVAMVSIGYDALGSPMTSPPPPPPREPSPYKFVESM